MGKLNMFAINLDQPQGVYMAGQVITGHCAVDLGEPMKMRGIRLNVKGEATVHWTETHTTGSGDNRRTETRHYRNHESYMDFVVVLFGNPQGLGGDSIMHPQGRHVYPFRIQLPPNLPSSFEGAHGRVRYSATATIDKPWKFDHNTKRAFTVLSVLDLNLRPEARNPGQGKNSKTLCCLCCASGPITAHLHIDRTGFVPGEFVTITGEVDNKSNRAMKSSGVSLKMITTFFATSKRRSVRKTISEIRKGRIEEGDGETWNGDQLCIPPLPPSSLIYCNIIDITYVIVMNVDPSGPSLDLDVPVGITIGTVPLANMMTTYASAPFANSATPFDWNMENAAIPNALPPSMPPPGSGPSAPPPSYSECVFGKVDIHDDGDTEYTKGDLNYAPVYTYYNWDNNQVPSAPTYSNQ